MKKQMAENILSNDLESEIAELTRQIEDKKRALEVENGIIHEDLVASTGKEMVSETIAEHFYPNSSAPGAISSDTDDEQTAPVVSKQTAPVAKDYLDALTPEVIEIVNSYVSMIPKDGIRKTVYRVQAEQPFLIDAFHDALVTRLYDELKGRGIIK